MNSSARSACCAASRPTVEMSTSVVDAAVPVWTALDSPLLAASIHACISRTSPDRQASSSVAIAWPSPSDLVTVFQPPARRNAPA